MTDLLLWELGLAFVQQWEKAGGKADPRDPGGMTCWGLSKRYHPRAYPNGRKPSKAQAVRYTRRTWWVAQGLAQLPAPLAIAAFDTTFHLGRGRGTEWLQRAHNAAARKSWARLNPDGGLGPVTRAALVYAWEHGRGERVLRLYLARRLRHHANLYEEDPGRWRWAIDGLLNRDEDLESLVWSLTEEA